MIVLISPYIGLTFNIECAMAGLNYLPLTTDSPDLMTCLSIFLFSWRVYVEDEKITMLYPLEFLSPASMSPIEPILIVLYVLFDKPYKTMLWKVSYSSSSVPF